MSTRATLKSSSVIATRSKSSIVLDHISFVTTSSNPFHSRIVESAFKKMLSPIYGDQKSAIAKINQGLDRTCEVMLKYDNPIGIIVYKNQLQNEYGLENALELKTLFLLNPTQNSRHGFGSRLFLRIDEVAREMGTNIIYCTASSKVQNSINCAIKNGYRRTSILEENEDQTLYLLIKELKDL